MDERKIQEIQDNIIKGIDKEIELDKQIESDSEEIAYNLLKNNKTKFIVDKRNYLFQYGTYINKKNKQCIVIYISDIEIVNKTKTGDYIPYIINSEIDNNFTLEENLKATVEAFLRHRLGLIKPEVLPDDE